MARLGTLASSSLSLALLAAALGGGCSQATIMDGGPDAGASVDGGLGLDAAGPPTSDLCFGGLNSTPETDCQAVACFSDPACCVGSAREDCCRAMDDRQLVELTSCTDGEATACFGADRSRVLFGDVLPVVENGGLVPEGGLGHGGVALAEPIDLRAVNVDVHGSFLVPSERCVDCVDVAGLAFLTAVPAAGQRAVVPFGVLLSGSRDEIAVLVADEVVARSALMPGARAVRLSTDVRGRGRVMVDEVPLAEVEGLALPAQARPAVFGRTSNRSGQDAVRVGAARVSSSSCDVPRALSRRAEPVLPWSGSAWMPTDVRRPSVVAWTADGVSRALMAYEHEGEIHLAGRTGFGEFRNATSDPGPPTFERPEALRAAREPWLFVHDERLVIVFVGVDEAGRSALWRSTGGPLRAQTFAAPALMLDPAELGLESLDQPTVLVEQGVWRMIARTHSSTGTSLVELMSFDDGLTWSLRGTVAGPRVDDVFAFDRDEVGSPALVEVLDAQGRQVVRLYYAGRRGTRSAIGLYVEGSGGWRRMGEVLGPEGQSFDGFGVTDPAPLWEDGALRLYYAGTDGVRWRFGLAGPIGTLGE